MKSTGSSVLWPLIVGAAIVLTGAPAVPASAAAAAPPTVTTPAGVFPSQTFQGVANSGIWILGSAVCAAIGEAEHRSLRRQS